MDLVIKTYLDQYCGKMPPCLDGVIPAVLMDDMTRLNRWRNWRTGLTCEFPEIGAKLIGALDDCLISKDGLYIPFDAKTKGSVPKDNGAQYYQTQLDCYCLMLQENGCPVADHAWLAYFSPKIAMDIPGSPMLHFGFDVTPYKVHTRIDAAKERIAKACELLRMSRPPEHRSCEFCQYHEIHDQLKNVVEV